MRAWKPPRTSWCPRKSCKLIHTCCSFWRITSAPRTQQRAARARNSWSTSSMRGTKTEPFAGSSSNTATSCPKRNPRPRSASAALSRFGNAGPGCRGVGRRQGGVARWRSIAIKGHVFQRRFVQAADVFRTQFGEQRVARQFHSLPLQNLPDRSLLLFERAVDGLHAAAPPDRRPAQAFLDRVGRNLAVFQLVGCREQCRVDAQGWCVGVTIRVHEAEIAISQVGGFVERALARVLAPALNTVYCLAIGDDLFCQSLVVAEDAPDVYSARRLEAAPIRLEIGSNV